MNCPLFICRFLFHSIEQVAALLYKDDCIFLILLITFCLSIRNRSMICYNYLFFETSIMIVSIDQVKMTTADMIDILIFDRRRSNFCIISIDGRITRMCYSFNLTTINHQCRYQRKSENCFGDVIHLYISHTSPFMNIRYCQQKQIDNL